MKRPPVKPGATTREILNGDALPLTMDTLPDPDMNGSDMPLPVPPPGVVAVNGHEFVRDVCRRCGRRRSRAVSAKPCVDDVTLKDDASAEGAP
jgi:hypothetical protein